jgi:alkylation response protein AidB-like acyl-CoA dehydrogenase
MKLYKDWERGYEVMLKLTDEQILIQKTARQIAEEKIAPRAKTIDEQQEFPYDIVKLFLENGFLTLMYPEEYGGINGDITTLCLVIEEIAKVCASCATTLVAHNTGAVAFLGVANEEQKKKFLLKDGKPNFFGFSTTEPNAGSNVAGVITRGKLEGDHYVVNGIKNFVTNGGVADVYVVSVRTGSDPRKGISAFVVEKDIPGFSVGKKENKMGMRGTSTTDLIFENAIIPVENLLGSEVGGFEVVMRTLDKIRVIIAALALGIAEGALNYAIKYAKSREQFNRPIAEFQGIRFMLADMATKVKSANLLVYNAAQQVDLGADMDEISKCSSMAKYYASDVAMEVTTNAVQILGGYGYIKDYPVERMMRDAKCTQIYEGTNQIQRIVVARNILAK